MPGKQKKPAAAATDVRSLQSVTKQEMAQETSHLIEVCTKKRLIAECTPLLFNP